MSVHTANLTQDLVNKIGKGEVVDIELDMPFTRENGTSLEPEYDPSLEPGAQTEETEATEAEQAEQAEEIVEETPIKKGSSRDAAYFLTEETDGTLRTIGLTEEGKQQKELEVPWEINGMTVTEIGGYTFDGAEKLTTIKIQSNITRILNNGFDGAPLLTSIQIDNEGQNVLVPGKDLFANVPTRAKVQVSKAHYGSFIADYFWGNYLERIENTGE